MERQEFQHEALSPLVFCVIVPISLLSPTWCCCCSDFGAIRECYYCSNAATVPRRRMWAVWKDRYEVKVRPRLKPHQVSSAWSSTPITFNPKPVSCVPTLVLHPDYCRYYSFLQLGIAFHLSWLELQTNHRKSFHNHGEGAYYSAFTIKTILRHCAKWLLT